MKQIRLLTTIAAVLVLSAILTVPAAAIDKGDVQSAISASSKEEVAGNIFIWFLCAIGFTRKTAAIILDSGANGHLSSGKRPLCFLD